AALLAAVLLAVAWGGCGGGGAEPGASKDATLILDFQPNAVHAGIYSALRRGYYADEGVRLHVRQPSDSTDAPKLLRAGRAQFAILDIHDFMIARGKGFDVVAIAPIVQRPLAAVIARDRTAVRTPRDLEGKRVGVTGLPSDDAVLDSVLTASGADLTRIKRVTIGFNAVADLRAGKIDAATAFWNAEGIALERAGVPTREFRVDSYGAPRYPELVLVTTGGLLHRNRSLARAVALATARGYRLALAHPGRSLQDLLRSASGLNRGEQSAQLAALRQSKAFESLASSRSARVGVFEPQPVLRAIQWDVMHGIVRQRRIAPHLHGMFESVCENETAAGKYGCF
ncbi:MAG: putative hydroxymethylpyrimidine transport system substrate-binding protein, partial [Solirubrobacterales bacterium]|nr:putative hydroxymethylpyrimidine transport system substrate-binding protein [Solirubrobacterales bacterium]